MQYQLEIRKRRDANHATSEKHVILMVLLLVEGKAVKCPDFLPYLYSEDSLDDALLNLQEWGYIEPPDDDADPAAYLDEAVIFTPAGEKIAEGIRHFQEDDAEIREFALSSGETYRIIRAEVDE